VIVCETRYAPSSEVGANPVTDVKLNRRQLRGYLSLVKTSRRGSSMDIAQMQAREKGRFPISDDHDTVVLASELAIKTGLVSGRPAVARTHVRVYLDLALTDKGEVRFSRLEHRLWLLSAAYEEIKGFAARVVAEILRPRP
jgi:hypothetical protein